VTLFRVEWLATAALVVGLVISWLVR